MSRTVGRVLAVAIGLIAGLAVLAVFASRLGLVDATSANPTASGVRQATPTVVQGAKIVTSLSTLALGQGLRSGDLIDLRLDETSLDQDVAKYLQESTQGVTVSNTRIRLLPGQVIFTGSVRQGVLAVEFTLTGHPTLQDSRLLLTVDSLEPALVGQFSSVKPGQQMELAPNLEARSVTLVDGLMVAVGTVR